MCLNCYRGQHISNAVPLILYVKHENMFTLLNITQCDHRNEKLPDITDTKHVGGRNEDIVRATVRAKK